MASYETRMRLVSQSQDISNNRSTVTIAFDFRRTDTQYWGYNSTGSAYWWIKCDGQSSGNQYFTFNWTIAQNTWKEVGRKSFTVSHLANGTKSISYSGYINFGSGVNPGSLSGSGSSTLNTIPRATTPSLSPTTVTMGNSMTITLSRASSSFTHTLYHDFYVGSWTQFASNVATSTTLQIPLSWASRIPNVTSGSGRILCRTYNGGTLIGEKISNFTASIPSSVVPTISSISVAETVSGLASQFGAFVQNKSVPQITINASGSYGSTIRSYRTVIGNQTYTSNKFTVSANSAATVTYTTTVTDSRGRTASTSGSYSVLAYSSPTINSFTVERCNSSGTITDDGTYARILGRFTMSSVGGKNLNSYKIEYKLSSASTWTTLISGNSYGSSLSYTRTINGGFITTESYDFRLVVADYFTSSTLERHITTSFTLMNWSDTGRGVGIGKVSEKDALEINMDIYDKYDTHICNGMSQYNSSNQIDPNTTLEHLILTNKNTPLSGRYFYIETSFYSDKSTTANRSQIATPYNTDSGIYHRYYYNGTWSGWTVSTTPTAVNSLVDASLTVFLNESNKVLWSGGYYMTAAHTANLNDSISNQKYGIVLIFNQYNSSNNTTTTSSWQSYFISKYCITIGNGYPWDMWMGESNFGHVCGKALYIYNDHIIGADINAQSGTANGITYENNAYIMRYVIGI